MNSKFEKSYQVRGHEIYPDYSLKSYHISSYFQDAVANFFTNYGLASFDIQKQNLTWIISNLRIDFLDKMPLWNESVKLVLWQNKVKSLRTIIDFKVILENRNVVVAQGSSSWSIINEKTRRPERLDLLLKNVPVIDEEIYPDFKFQRLKEFFGETSALAQTIRSYDLDFNKHLNNVRYLAGAIETIPIKFREEHKLKTLEINFLQEVFYNEKLVGVSFRNEHKFFHQLIKEENSSEVCRMITEWETK